MNATHVGVGKVDRPDGERGSALVITVLILLAVSALATMMLVTSQGDHLVSANERDAERALAASKSGLAYAYQRFDQRILVPTPAGVAFDSFDSAVSTALEGAEFTGTVGTLPSAQGQVYQILSTGTFGRSTRQTELLFQIVPEAFKYGYMAFNEATLHNHSGLAGPSFRIESTVFSNGAVSVPNDLTLDGAIVGADEVKIGTGSIVKRDVFANSVSNSGTIEGRAVGVCSVSSLPDSAVSWDRVDNQGNKFEWLNGNSTPGSVGGGTIVGGTSTYTIQDNDEFRFSIFRDDGGLIPDPDLNVARYAPPPMLDYYAMKTEADLNDPTYFTSMGDLAAYIATKKVTEVIDGKTLVTARVGTVDAQEFIYLDDDFDLTIDPAGSDGSNEIAAHSVWIEGGIYTTGSFVVSEATFDPAVYPPPPTYYAFVINALPYCYPAILAYEQPSTGTLSTWEPADTPAVGDGGSINMKSGSPHGGFVLVNGLSFSQNDTHLHHTQSALELIRFNGAELAAKIHNCDYFHFTYDPAVRCTRFLIADEGTPEVVSYREVR